MKKQSGFTLIELVIVVVILGFLAVTAIPKFIDLTDQAKQANIEGMAGGFATGVSLVRAQWEAEGRQQNNSNQNVVNYDGVQMLLTTEDVANNVRAGYVVASTSGVNDGEGLGAGFTSANCLDIWNNILQQPPKITDSLVTLNNDNSMNYFATQSGTDDTALCVYYLKETLNKDANGNYTTPANTAVGNNFTYSPSNSYVQVIINQ